MVEIPPIKMVMNWGWWNWVCHFKFIELKSYYCSSRLRSCVLREMDLGTAPLVPETQRTFKNWRICRYRACQFMVESCWITAWICLKTPKKQITFLEWSPPTEILSDISIVTFYLASIWHIFWQFICAWLELGKPGWNWGNPTTTEPLSTELELWPYPPQLTTKLTKILSATTRVIFTHAWY